MVNEFFQTELCAKCRGRGFCKRPCRIYSKIKDFIPKTKTHFSGSSPPEIFVGRFNYPNINTGILAPDNSELTKTDNSSIESFSMPEDWHENKFSIEQILSKRGSMVYGRFSTSVKQIRNAPRLLSLMQEISMSYKSVSTEFFLKKPPKQTLEINKNLPLIGNPAPLQFARLEENPKVKPKVDYLVSDIDSKAANSIIELYQSKIEITNINKILSAGLLGLRTQRRLVPTRWAITAVDDAISKNVLKKIRYYPEISEILVFHSEYVGNHYEILLLPDKYSFEVLEAEMRGGLWNQTNNVSIMQDYEFFHGRTYYADEVTGAYYANRLALTEYLEKIKRQATAIFFREVRPEYYAPLGVGILREVTREAFRHEPEKFTEISQALKSIQSRLKLPVSVFQNKSVLLKEFGKQKRLSQWF
ncbi:MAG: hypothetical protein PHF67_05400 [Candidatus Nanoarchaeia archaeon]|nr:hypothetical protein [Candidatus Nanoarchaeia archaeon]